MRLVMIALLVLLVYGWPTSAHPHIWIDGTFDLELDSGGLRSLGVSWLFDEFNSAQMIGMFDDNRDGLISASESEDFRLEAFEHLRDRDYFVLASLGQERLAIPDARSFKALVENGKLRYSFELPLRVHWTDLEGLVFAFFDPSYFTDFLSTARRETYTFEHRELLLISRTLRLESKGWGTIRVPALQAGLR